MKSVLISIQPQWCELIASGKKTVEVRKTIPKIDTPFKCYIYQTRKTWVYSIYQRIADAQGKVIGEFVCDEIYQYTSKFGRPIWQEEDMTISDEDMETQSCMTQEELFHYENFPDSYKWGLLGWHISDLVIYDEPKELSEFYTDYCPYLHNQTCCNNELCAYQEYNEHGDIKPCVKEVKRPPQSWCYIEGNVI